MDKILFDNYILLFSGCVIVVFIVLLAVYIKLRDIKQKLNEIMHETPLKPKRLGYSKDGFSGNCPTCKVAVVSQYDEEECKLCHQRLRWPTKNEINGV